MSARVSIVLFPVLAAVGACSVLVDTSDLDRGPAVTSDGGADATAGSDGSTNARLDAGLDARDGGAAIPSTAVVWPVNGHGYEVVKSSDLAWVEAKVLAEARGGHLATTLTKEENDFVWSLVAAAGLDKGWLGGFQSVAGAGVNEGWTWVTGEPWGFTAWFTEEPNDYAGTDERAVGYYSGPLWADFQHEAAVGVGAYVVEYE